MLDNAQKHISSFLSRVAEFCNDWLDVTITLQRNSYGEVLQRVSIRYLLTYGAVMAMVGIVVSYTFYFSALLKAEEDFSAQMLSANSRQVDFSLASGEAVYSQEIRIQTKRVGEITGIEKDGTLGRVLPVYNLALYSPDTRLIVDGKRMINHNKLLYQVAVIKSDSEEVLLEEGWEPSAPGSQTILFAFNEATSKETK